MANKRHLARLKQGVEAWNQWRESNPHINPDLSIADLTWMVPSEERLAQLVQVEEQLQHAVEAWKRWAVEADINGMVEVGSGNVRLRLRPGTNLHEFIIERVEVVEASDRSSEANPHIELITTREEVVWASDRSPEANPHIEPDLSGADPIKMACTQEHLTRLQQAVEAWDRSRAVPLDLTDAGLMGAVLRGVDLAGAHLTGAELLGTDLGALRNSYE
jgi:hypothetical protein